MKKFVEFIKKYWKLCLAAAGSILLGLALWDAKRAQEDVLENHVKSQQKIDQATTKMNVKIDKVEDVATVIHEARVDAIKKTEIAETKEIKKELTERIAENEKSSNVELSKKIAATFGVNVVMPGGENEE